MIAQLLVFITSSGVGSFTATCAYGSLTRKAKVSNSLTVHLVLKRSDAVERRQLICLSTEVGLETAMISTEARGLSVITECRTTLIDGRRRVAKCTLQFFISRFLRLLRAP
mmetsp:Transcript_21413/g.51441  ORF Transcript_21413/g.51441 Transcript_21413/m.51441 type:complete len:111 (-) Transcript_21413:666-998(-)